MCALIFLSTSTQHIRIFWWFNIDYCCAYSVFFYAYSWIRNFPLIPKITALSEIKHELLSILTVLLQWSLWKLRKGFSLVQDPFYSIGSHKRATVHRHRSVSCGSCNALLPGGISTDWGKLHPPCVNLRMICPYLKICDTQYNFFGFFYIFLFLKIFRHINKSIFVFSKFLILWW